MNLKLGSPKKEHNKTFELVLQVRDKTGKSIGQTKSYGSDDATKLHEFFVRNSSTKSKKKKTKAAKSAKEITEGLNEAEQHTKIIRRKRKLED